MLHWHFLKHELRTPEDVRGEAEFSSSNILETNVLICVLHRQTILENFVDAMIWGSWIKPFVLLACGNVYGPPKFSKHVSICSKEGCCGVGTGLLPLDPSAALTRILPGTEPLPYSPKWRTGKEITEGEDHLSFLQRHSKRMDQLVFLFFIHGLDG